MRGHDRESQSGVPFPGVKLPRDKWSRTRTGLGAPGTVLDWDAVFGRQAKRVLDLGCGNGRFLIGSAIARPDVDHVGIELVPQAVKFASLRAGQRGLTNVKIAWGDASEFVLERCASGSIDEIHLYHPQPYYEPGQKARRQLTPAILRAIHRALVPGGLFVFQTDNAAFARYAREIVPLLFTWAEHKGPWPEAPEGRTLREITARRLGLSIVRAEATRLDLDDAEVDARVARMAEPVFDANRPAFRDDDDEADDGYAGQAGIFRGRTRSKVTGTSGGLRDRGGRGGRGGKGQGGAGGGGGRGGAGPAPGAKPGSAPDATPRAASASGPAAGPAKATVGGPAKGATGGPDAGLAKGAAKAPAKVSPTGPAKAPSKGSPTGPAGGAAKGIAKGAGVPPAPTRPPAAGLGRPGRAGGKGRGSSAGRKRTP